MLGNYLVAPADGLYYIGVHGISDAKMFYLFIDYLSIEAGIDCRVPAPPAMELQADADGIVNCSVTVTAPKADLAGDPLDGPVTVKVYRDGEFCGEIANLQPGVKGTLTDTPNQRGYFNYTAVAENQYGTGASVEGRVYVGINVPSTPQNVQMVETTEGCVKLTWDPIDTDIDSMPLNPDKVKYTVINGNGDILAEGLSACSYESRIVPEGKQDFVVLGVYGVTDSGEGKTTVVPMLAVGTPFAAPFLESVAGSELSLPIGAMNYDDAFWDTYTDESFTDISSSDQDGGFFACKATRMNAAATLYTGKIAIGDLSSPALYFYTFNHSDGTNPNPNELTVDVTCDGQTEQVASVVMSELENEGWNKVTVPISEYAGKNIQIAFTATCKRYSYTMLDAIRVDARMAQNLSADNLSAPAEVKAGAEFDVAFKVVNNGTEAAGGFLANLYCNGKLVATQNMEDALEPNASTIVTFKQVLNAMNEPLNTYSAEVVYAADMAPQDNMSKEVTVAVLPSLLPAPRNLTGEPQDAGNQLTWDTPDVSDAPVTVTEGFEDFDNDDTWSLLPEGWTMVDNDGAPVGGFSGTEVPGWGAGDKSTWKVIDGTVIDPGNGSLLGHNGSTHYVGSMFNSDASQNDEWLISPMLYGGAQTISFYAKSFSTQYGKEKIRVLYSTTGTDLADFTVAEPGVQEVPGDWTEFSIDLPEGAKYFAINCLSQDIFFLMIDDITYVRLGNASEQSIIGYNVYRDGQLLATVNDTSYFDTDCAGCHEYAVTAVYTKGESAPSNILTITNSEVGINGIVGDTFNGDVYNLQGIRLMRQVPASTLRELPAGIYIHAGRKVEVK